MPATITVDTDGVSGAHPSLSVAVNSLGTLTDDTIIECAASTGVADTTAVTVDIDTTVNYRLTIRPAAGERHSGIWDAGKYRLEIGGSDYLTIEPDGSGYSNVTVDGLQMRKTSQASNYQPLVFLNNPNRGSIEFTGNIIRGATGSSSRARLFWLDFDNSSATDPTLVMANNLIYDMQTTSHSVSSIIGWLGDDVDAYVYNNTFVGCSRFMYATAGLTRFVLKNNIVTTLIALPDTYTYSTNCRNNASTLAEDFGGTSERQSQTFTFAGASDYHLSESDTGAQGHGVDLSADGGYAFSTDIDGDTRADWDIGADEIASASGVSIPVVSHHLSQQGIS
jgi:hypothetical protein